jgi:hypothetical protein
MKKSSVVGLVLLGSIFAGTALAGVRESRRVTVNITARRAEGSIGSTRNSSQATEYIQCTMSGDASYNSLVCLAVDPDGRTATCYLTNPPAYFLNTLNTLQGDSMLTFLWEYPSNKCTGMIVSNGSRWEPKVLAPASGAVVF